MYRFVDEYFPLLVAVTPAEMVDEDVDELIAHFERFFARGERYALLCHTPPGTKMPRARERKRIAEWANSPHIRALSAKHCIGTAIVVPNALIRGALTALLWVWTPATPLKTVSTLEEGFDWCADELERAKLALPLGRAAMRLALLEDARRTSADAFRLL